MNADALLLYSYLMRQDIPFTRFCHPAYRDRTQWIQSLKKSKLEPIFPVCRVFVNTTGGFLAQTQKQFPRRNPILPQSRRNYSRSVKFCTASPTPFPLWDCCSTKSTSAGCRQTTHCGNRSCCAFRPVRTLPVC